MAHLRADSPAYRAARGASGLIQSLPPEAKAMLHRRRGIVVLPVAWVGMSTPGGNVPHRTQRTPGWHAEKRWTSWLTGRATPGGGGRRHRDGNRSISRDPDLPGLDDSITTGEAGER
jgi:hypothetical protein